MRGLLCRRCRKGALDDRFPEKGRSIVSISPAQVTEARRLLRRGSTWLAKASHVDYSTVVGAQQSRATDPDPSVMAALRRTLEAAGVEFPSEEEGGAAVRLRKPSAAA